MLREVLRAVRRPVHELKSVLLDGQSTVFDLSSPLRQLPAGWVEIDFHVGAARKAQLLVDSGVGFEALPLPLPRNGRVRAIARLPDHVAGLRLEIGDGATVALRVRELGWPEAAARLAAPVIRRRLSEPWTIPAAAMKLVRGLKNGGLMQRLLQKERHEAPQLWYPEWHEEYGALSDADRAAIREKIAQLRDPPRFSVIMPVYETAERWLARAIESVRAQLYPHWELCIADDASKEPHVRRLLEKAASEDPRIKVVFRERNGHIAAASNSALALASGDFLVLLDHDDELTEHALYLLAEEIRAHPEADLIYSDEDKIDERGRLRDPHFKPDWNPDLFFSQNYLAHVCAMRRERVRQVGGFREGFEGSQDYDLYLRVAEPGRVRHVPFVLYHWRAAEGSTAAAASAKIYAQDAARRALEEHVRAPVALGPFATTYRVRWPVPSPPPLVSLLIPTRDGRELLQTCVESLLEKTSYRGFELVIVDNQSSAPDALEYLSNLERRGAARVLRYDQPFNFAAINNFAVREARGDYVGLLNNDLEIIEPGWLEEMLSHAARPGVGAVGARLLYPDRPVQHAGVILGIGGVAGHGHKHLSADAEGYFCRARLTQDFSALTAACLLVRRDTYLAVGGLDEELAVAFNDIDFCLRLRERGLRNVWTPWATLIHRESKSRGRETTPSKMVRFRREFEEMKRRWGDKLLADPAYNPNLTLDAENFSLAWPPRVRRPWRQD